MQGISSFMSASVATDNTYSEQQGNIQHGITLGGEYHLSGGFRIGQRLPQLPVRACKLRGVTWCLAYIV